MKSSEILRRAKKVLWNGRYSLGHSGHVTHICYAIDCANNGRLLADRRKADQIKAVIMKRLGCGTYEDWIRHSYPMKYARAYDDGTRERRLQQGRHAWVDALIKEYEAKGD